MTKSFMTTIKGGKRRTRKMKGGKTKKMKGGKCNCNKNILPFFDGGNANMEPYPLNPYDPAPRDLMESVRMNPNMNGGKKRKMRKQKRKTCKTVGGKHKKMTGGFVMNAGGYMPFSMNDSVSAGNMLSSGTVEV
jgi:hypothetical protein